MYGKNGGNGRRMIRISKEQNGAATRGDRPKFVSCSDALRN